MLLLLVGRAELVSEILELVRRETEVTGSNELRVDLTIGAGRLHAVQDEARV
jgi:hypothetical protein